MDDQLHGDKKLSLLPSRRGVEGIARGHWQLFGGQFGCCAGGVDFTILASIRMVSSSVLTGKLIANPALRDGWTSLMHGISTVIPEGQFEWTRLTRDRSLIL